MFPYFQKTIFDALNLTSSPEDPAAITSPEKVQNTSASHDTEPLSQTVDNSIKIDTEITEDEQIPITIETTEGFTLISTKMAEVDSNTNGNDLRNGTDNKNEATTFVVGDDVDSNEAADQFPQHNNNIKTNGKTTKTPSYIMELGEKRKRLRLVKKKDTQNLC